MALIFFSCSTSSYFIKISLKTFLCCQGIRGYTSINQYTPQPRRAYCEIPGNIGVSIRKEGDSVLCACCGFKRATGSRLRGPGWVRASIRRYSLRSPQNCAKSMFLEGNLGTFCMAFLANLDDTKWENETTKKPSTTGWQPLGIIVHYWQQKLFRIPD